MEVEGAVDGGAILPITIASEMGICSRNTAHTLFNNQQQEIVLYLFQFLWFQDLVRLAPTSHFFADIISSEEMKRVFLSRLFERIHRFPVKHQLPLGLTLRGSIWRLCERLSTPMIFTTQHIVTNEIAMDTIVNIPTLNTQLLATHHAQGRETTLIFEVGDSHFPCFPFKFSRQYYQSTSSASGARQMCYQDGTAVQSLPTINNEGRSKFLIESVAPFSKVCYCSYEDSSAVAALVPTTQAMTHESSKTWGAATLSCIAYYEAIFEINNDRTYGLAPCATECQEINAIAIGLSNPLFSFRKLLLGCDHSSFGLLQVGDLFHKGHVLYTADSGSNGNGSSSDSSVNMADGNGKDGTFAVGDVVGCGIIYPPLSSSKKGQLFFTKNGILLFVIELPDEDTLSAPWFPSVMHPPSIRSKFCFGVDQAFMFNVLGFEEQRLKEMASSEASMCGTGWTIYDTITRQQHEVWNVPKHPIFLDPYYNSCREMQILQIQKQQMQHMHLKMQHLQDQLCMPLATETIPVIHPISSNSSVAGNQDDNVSLASTTALAGMMVRDDAHLMNMSPTSSVVGLPAVHNSICSRVTDYSLFFHETLRKECTLLVGRAIDRQLDSSDSSDAETSCRAGSSNSGDLPTVDKRYDTEEDEDVEAISRERDQQVRITGMDVVNSNGMTTTSTTGEDGKSGSKTSDCRNSSLFISRGTLSSRVEANGGSKLEQEIQLARGSSDADENVGVPVRDNSQSSRNITFNEGTTIYNDHYSNSFITSAANLKAEQQQSLSRGINFDCINNDAVFDADGENDFDQAVEMNTRTSCGSVGGSGGGSVKLLPYPRADDDHDWCADSMAVELSSVDSVAVNEFRGCGISKVGSNSSATGGNASTNGSVNMVTTADNGGAGSAAVRTGFMALADAARAHDWLRNASNGANAQNAHLCFLESVFGVSTGQSDAYDSERSVATSLFVEVASLDEDGSYIGYGAACEEEEEVDEADECSAGKQRNTHNNSKVQASHGLSLHPYGRPAGLSNGTVNGRARAKVRHRRGYDSDESFPNRRPVFGGSTTSPFPVDVKGMSPPSRRSARSHRGNRDGSNHRSNRSNGVDVFTESISMSNNGKRKRGQYFQSTSASAKVNYKHRNVDGMILKVLNNRPQPPHPFHLKEPQFPMEHLQQASSAMSSPIFPVHDPQDIQEHAQGVSDPFMSSAHRLQCQNILPLQPPLLQLQNIQQQQVKSVGPRSVASSNQSMDNSSCCELDQSAEGEDGYDGASERGRGENDCLDEASDNDLDMTIDVVRSEPPAVPDMPAVK